MFVALTISLTWIAQPPSQPPAPTTQKGETAKPSSVIPSFSTGVFPIGATMVSADANGELAVETIATEVMPQTATRQVPVQGADGTMTIRTEQFTVTTTAFKLTKRPLPKGTKIYRDGREISDDEKRSLRERTPLFVTQLGSSNTPPGQGYEAVFGKMLVAFVPIGPTPRQGVNVAQPAAPRPVGESSSIEQEVVGKVNEARAAAGLPPLKVDARLMKAARQHSENMAKVGRLDHVLDGKGPAERLADLGSRPSFAGENVAQGQQNSAEAMESWMSSPGHRGNILNPSYTHIGIGKADGPSGPYWTQVFARIDE